MFGDGIKEHDNINPEIKEIVERKAYASSNSSCKCASYPVKIKKKCGGYFVYYLVPVKLCYTVHCFGMFMLPFKLYIQITLFFMYKV